MKCKELDALSRNDELTEEQYESICGGADVCQNCKGIFEDDDLEYDMDYHEEYGEYCIPCWNKRAKEGTLYGSHKEELPLRGDGWNTSEEEVIEK